MEILRKEVLEEMVRNGRSYKEEVKKLAAEALMWREGKDPLAYDGVVINVPGILLLDGYHSPTKIREMMIGETSLIRFEPSFAKYIYTVVHRMPVPK